MKLTTVRSYFAFYKSRGSTEAFHSP